MRLHFVGLVALVGCSSSEAPTPPPTLIEPDPPVTSIPHATVPVAFRGPFHRGGHLDEINLVLEDDGSFRWRIFGCDFSGGGSGEWTAISATMLELHATRGKPLMWMDEASFANPVTVVRLRAGASGTIVAQALRSSSAVIEQTWHPGQVCASCGHGTLGPDRLPLRCAEPIP